MSRKVSTTTPNTVICNIGHVVKTEEGAILLEKMRSPTSAELDLWWQKETP